MKFVNKFGGSVSSFSHDGKQFDADDNGVFEIPEGDVTGALVDHLAQSGLIQMPERKGSVKKQPPPAPPAPPPVFDETPPPAPETVPDDEGKGGEGEGSGESNGEGAADGQNADAATDGKAE